MSAQLDGPGDAVSRGEMQARKCCARHRDRRGGQVRIIGHRPGDGVWVDSRMRLCAECIDLLHEDPRYHDAYRVVGTVIEGGQA